MPFPVKVYHKTKQHEVTVEDDTTFGQLKHAMATITGVQPAEQKLYFRGRPREDDETMADVGLKPGAKILLVECENYRQRRADEMDAEQEEAKAKAAEAERQRKSEEEAAQKALVERQSKEGEERKREEELKKSMQAIDDVGREVDTMADEIDEMETSMSNGQEPDEKRSRVINELLTQKLLKLDAIKGDDEIRQNRKAQIKRIEGLSERLEGLSKGAAPDDKTAVAVVDKRSAAERGG